MKWMLIGVNGRPGHSVMNLLLSVGLACVLVMLPASRIVCGGTCAADGPSASTHPAPCHDVVGEDTEAIDQYQSSPRR